MVCHHQPVSLGSLQVCREFQRGTCSRQPSDCRYAHPTENVTVDCGDNQVTVCMDYVKNKCTRDSCRYFHPPAHLQSQIKAAQQRANAAPPSGSGPAHSVVGSLLTFSALPLSLFTLSHSVSSFPFFFFFFFSPSAFFFFNNFFSIFFFFFFF